MIYWSDDSEIVYDNILIDILQLQFQLFPVSGGVKTMDLIIVVTLLSLGCAKGQFFEDRRCRCVCPSPASVLNTTNTRQIYTGNVPPNQCDCEGVVFPLLRKELEGKLHIFCPRCECVFQTRNTTLIMAIVFMILTGLSMSILYMVSLTWLKLLVERNNRNQTDRSAERDYIHEHRGEFERQRERERKSERNRDANPESEEEGLLVWDPDK